jgi:hypothetical protein
MMEVQYFNDSLNQKQDTFFYINKIIINYTIKMKKKIYANEYNIIIEVLKIIDLKFFV